MTDSREVDVEIDGVIDDEPSGTAPAWGLPVAVAIVGALALVVFLRVVLPGALGDRGQSRTGEAPPKTETSFAEVEDPRVTAAQAALRAWGRFAGSADLGELAGHLVPDGPQYRQLASDVGVPGPVRAHARRYEVTLKDARLGEASPGEAIVIGTVVWTRSGEQDQRYTWELDLRSDGNAWRLWTVRAVSGGEPDS